MDWKEGAKYAAIIVGSSVASGLLVWFIQNRLNNQVAITAKAAANAEVSRILTEAASKVQAQTKATAAVMSARAQTMTNNSNISVSPTVGQVISI